MKHLSLSFLLFTACLFMACNNDDEMNDCNQPTACSLVPDPGPCFAYMPRYYFNEKIGQCEEFIWGGCDGLVPFENMEDCQACLCND